MITVLGAGASPFVRKVRVLLEEKGIPYEHEPIFPFGPNPEFRKVSPLGKIPAIKHDGKPLADSSVCCAYLERVHPTPPLYPSDPYEYGRALWFEEFADSGMVAVVGAKIFFPRVVAAKFMNQKPDESAIAAAIANDLPPLFDYLESELGDGDAIVGKSFSIADIAILSQLVNLSHAGVDVDAKRWPKLAAYARKGFARPVFAKMIAEDRASLGLG